MKKRKSGLLLHISSLPSKFGIGDFGHSAFRFADFLIEAGQSCWQILPLNPFVAGGHYSPYDPASTFAGNTLFISPELLYHYGLLEYKDLRQKPVFASGKVEYSKVVSYKRKLFKIAYKHFSSKPSADYKKFCYENRCWLDDYALYVAIGRKYKSCWTHWPPKIRKRKDNCLDSAKDQLCKEFEKEKFLQFIFYKQFLALKKYCNKNKIQIIGDLPFYIAHNSVDVWSNPQLFKLKASGKPRFVGGVPPDAFSKTGQLWGNPVYNWNVLEKTKYKWWIKRIKHNLVLYDTVRLDHFRGFLAYWQIPADAKTAKPGRWIKAPAENFFDKLFKNISTKSIIAEDLGLITEDVKKIIRKYDLPGMKVLQFGFSGDMASNPHYIDNHTPDNIVYTGTHDNNTIIGWLKTEISRSQKKLLTESLGASLSSKDVNWRFIELAMSSVAEGAIIPVQDILGLNENSRMNRPWLSKGNWQWRLHPGQLKASTAKKLLNITKSSSRYPV